MEFLLYEIESRSTVMDFVHRVLFSFPLLLPLLIILFSIFTLL